MKEDNKWELRLFQILRVRGNVYYLVDDKHSYSDVTITINKYRDMEFLVKNDDMYVLTQKGQKRFHYLCKMLNKKGFYKFFMEDVENRIIAISKEDIYIPRKSFEWSKNF